MWGRDTKPLVAAVVLVDFVFPNVVEFVAWVTPAAPCHRFQAGTGGCPTGATDSVLTGKSGRGFLECSILNPQWKEEEEERRDEDVMLIWHFQPKRGWNYPKHNNLPCFGGW